MSLGAFSPLPVPLRAHATEGMSAEQHARLCADLRGAVLTAPFAVLWANGAVVAGYISQVSVGATSPPTIAPLGGGVYTVTWAASYADAYGQSQPTSIRVAVATACGTPGPPAFATAEITSAATVEVRLRTAAGAGIQGQFCLVVY